MEQETERLTRAALDILSAADSTAICQKLLSYLQNFIVATHIRVLLIDINHTQTVLYRDVGLISSSIAQANEILHQETVRKTLRLGEALLLSGEVDAQLLAALSLGLLTPLGAVLLAPLKVSGNTIGIVILGRSDSRQPFTQGDARLSTFLASQAAAAVETSRLYLAEFQRIQIEETLLRAGRKLSEGLNPQELPARILEQLAIVVPYERGSLLLQEKDVLKIAAQRGFPDDERVNLLSIRLREGDVYSQIATSLHPVLIDDVTQSPGWTQVEWLPLNLSWMSVPLFSKDRVVGMVSLTRREKNAFSQEDVLLVSTFAMQAAVALENAALYEEITRFSQHLEQMVQQRTDELRKALTTLERMDQSKSDFINVAAHELRTPLTIMKGYVGMMQADRAVQANPFLLQILNGVQKGAERLHEIVNSMLDLARIDNQVLSIQSERVSFSTIARRIQADYEDFLVERKQVMRLVDLENLPPLMGDANLLLKVFQSIIINAIKYTPDGGTITVSAQRLQDEQTGDCLDISIQDTGIGIDPQDHELIFEKLFSAGKVALHSSSKASFKGGGPGLGLTIARGVVQAHKGRIWVESEGCNEETCPGSCFHVLLPVAAG